MDGADSQHFEIREPTTFGGSGDFRLGIRIDERFGIADGVQRTRFEGDATLGVSAEGGVAGHAEFDEMDLEVASRLAADGGRILFNGSTVRGTGVLAASATGTLEQNDGRVTAVSIDIATGGAYDLNSGRLETIQFNGDFFQDGGTFAPGAAPGSGSIVGATTLTGDYTMSGTAESPATLELELATRTAFDRLTIGGDLNLLSGELSVVALDGFSVSAGDFFNVVDVAGTRSGTFLGLAEGSAIGGLGNAFSITYAAGDGNDVALVSTLTPGSVNLPVAGASDFGYVYTTRVPGGDGAIDTTIDLRGLDILPGGDFTLGFNEELNLDNGDGTLFVSEGSTFTGNGLVRGNILNAGLVRIPIVAITRTTGGYVEVLTPTPRVVSSAPVAVNAGTYTRFTSPSVTVETPDIVVAGRVAFDASLEVTGDFTRTDTGALRLFIGGDTAGVSYSQLTVGQAVALDGTIEVVLQPELFDTFDYELAIGDTFDFVVAAGGVTLAEGLVFEQFVTLAGAAALGNAELIAFDSGISSDPDRLFRIGGDPLFSFALVEGGTVLRATAIVAVPEPATALLLAAGTLALATRRHAA